VTRGRIEAPLEAAGSVAWNERDVAVVQARAGGYVEKLYVRAPLDAVKQATGLPVTTDVHECNQAAAVAQSAAERRALLARADELVS